MRTIRNENKQDGLVFGVRFGDRSYETILLTTTPVEFLVKLITWEKESSMVVRFFSRFRSWLFFSNPRRF